MKTFWKILFGSFFGCLIAILAGLFILIGSLSSIASLSSKSDTAAIPSATILKLDLSKGLNERGVEELNINPLSGNFSMSKPLSVLNTIRAIDAAASDPAVKLIYLPLDNAQISITLAEEVRAALVRFRESGKPIIAYATSYTLGSYYLASVADKVVMHEYGDAQILGLASNLMFFKDIIEYLGADVQLIRHGKYKAAGEQFTKNGLTPENREQNEVLLKSIWKTLVESIADSRDFTAEQFEGWVDNLELIDASSMLERGLIDKCCFQNEFKEYLSGLAGFENVDKMSITSLEKYIGARVKAGSGKQKIAILYADGDIANDSPDKGIGGKQYAAQIEKICKDSTVKAVVLRVNSPGGSAQAAEMIRHELVKLQESKPVVVSFGNYAASGGYWISAGGDKVFTNNTTITGSIGVFSMVPIYGPALRKTAHVNMESVSVTPHADMLSGIRRLDGDEVAYMEKMVEKIYTDFTSLVAKGRNMTVEQADEIGQGRVWTGRDALANGLADEKGGLIDALNYTRTAYGLENAQIVEYPAAKKPFDKILGMMTGESEVSIAPAGPVEKIKSLLDDPACIYARIPYQMDIK